MKRKPLHIYTDKNTCKYIIIWAYACVFCTYYGKTPPISISLSKPNDVEDKNGSWESEDKGSLLLLFAVPLAFVFSLLSSSTIPNADSESSAGNESIAPKIGVDGGTKGFVELFNDDDNEEGSCLTIFDVATDIAGELFVGELNGTPFNKHFFSNSWKI